jgi:hypothetical protein
MKRLIVAAFLSLALLEVSSTRLMAQFDDFIGPNGGAGIGVGIRGPRGAGFFAGLLCRRPAMGFDAGYPIGDCPAGYAMDAPVVDPVLAGYSVPAQPYAATPYHTNSGIGQANYAVPDYWFGK